MEFLALFGGLFVCHPGGSDSTYTVHVADGMHPVTQGLDDFELTSEQYYVLVDPANHVLATTLYPAERSPTGANVIMPIAWVRHFGTGRVFTCSLGHDARTLSLPPVLEMTTRGLLWTARHNEKERK